MLSDIKSMRLQFLSLFLLLTVNSPLASAQWESDRFLFESLSPAPRPKAKKSGTPTNQKTMTNPPKSTAVPNTLVPVEDSVVVAREPAHINASTVKLGAQLGFVDLDSKSQKSELKFNHGSYSFAVNLALPVGDTSEIAFAYSSAPALRSFRREEILLENNYKLKLFNYLFVAGPAFRQTSFWGSASAEDYRFQQVNTLGAGTRLELPAQGKWRPQFSVQLFPLLLETESSLRATLANFEWTSFLETEAGRAWLLNLGYERLEIINASDSAGNLTQGQIKFFFGYRLTTR